MHAACATARSCVYAWRVHLPILARMPNCYKASSLSCPTQHSRRYRQHCLLRRFSLRRRLPVLRQSAVQQQRCRYGCRSATGGTIHACTASMYSASDGTPIASASVL